ncbi:isochorismatase family protein [Ewingella americana]|uniref:isochorismatase family protein n=1 Tax=Ewingella americana TaxID=41202 RepID=UPI00163B29F2|nr:isochorismatase family protein [Ewingella americana]QMV52003.1 cysteine hydrolase [Ewingella americana]
MKKMMNVFYGCQMFNRKLAYRIHTLIKNRLPIYTNRTPTALVINTLHSGHGIRKFLSDYDLVSDSDLQHLFISFDNYKIPIFLVIEDLYSKAVRLTDSSHLADMQSSLLMANTHQLLPRMNPSAFSATGLDKELNKLGTKKIIFSGEMTPSGLASTRRDAELLGYQVAFAKNLTEIDDKLIKVKYSVNSAQGMMPVLTEINLL